MTPLNSHEMCYMECLFIQGKLKRSPREDWCYSVIRQAWVSKRGITTAFDGLATSFRSAATSAHQLKEAMERLAR